ncbi:hypothetical protein L917_17407 [Phytophthora nicotianae]|uniref:RxLR effector protein n=1 Tax=Phytophthora nicotianae TaxID=4792 RepID=W2KB08_PHYNI|nr:hypothetical protein L917_17407 [Phytophthora nicotianae]
MRFSTTLAVFMAPLLWSWINFTDAKNTGIINNMARASNVRFAVNKTRRLRRVQYLQDEERMEAIDVGMANVVNPAPSAHSAQTTESHKPLLKLGNVSKIIFIYWILVGGLVGFAKLVHMSSNDNTGSA